MLLCLKSAYSTSKTSTLSLRTSPLYAFCFAGEVGTLPFSPPLTGPVAAGVPVAG